MAKTETNYSVVVCSVFCCFFYFLCVNQRHSTLPDKFIHHVYASSWLASALTGYAKKLISVYLPMTFLSVIGGTAAGTGAGGSCSSTGTCISSARSAPALTLDMRRWPRGAVLYGFVSGAFCCFFCISGV